MTLAMKQDGDAERGDRALLSSFRKTIAFSE